jgi:hypothetical protein
MPAGKEEIAACLHVAFQDNANPKNEGEIDYENRAVDWSQVNRRHQIDPAENLPRGVMPFCPLDSGASTTTDSSERTS